MACMKSLPQAIEDLLEAIDNKGPAPRYHDLIMNKHREEWPLLWERIDALREVLAEEYRERELESDWGL